MNNIDFALLLVKHFRLPKYIFISIALGIMQFVFEVFSAPLLNNRPVKQDWLMWLGLSLNNKKARKHNGSHVAILNIKAQPRTRFINMSDQFEFSLF